MFYIALVIGLIQLVVTNGIVFGSKKPVRHVLVAVVLFGVLFGYNGVLFFPPVFFQSLLLAGAVWLWYAVSKRPWHFIPLSGVATVAVYSVVSWLVYQDLVRLQQLYPYVSMEQRLPVPRAAYRGEALSSEGKERLAQFEVRPGIQGAEFPFGGRTRFFEELHERTVQTFVNSTGFGVGRMRWDPDHRDWPVDPIPQPFPRPASGWSAGARATQPPILEEATSAQDLREMHAENVVDFVDARGFGFFKDRRHVAGFVPHRFRYLSRSKPEWKLQTLDLVGLVVHDSPVAYVSANLPRMDELRDAPTRPLDEFETTALKAIQRGEDLFLRETQEERRLLGSIRSAKQCVNCHGGRRGDLLGAFSYTFAARPPE